MDEADDMPMSSQRPYLLRALWEWIGDNGMTPHLLVDAGWGGVVVPPHTIKDGKVVLNIAERAVAHLHMGNEEIAFSARFGGVTHAVIVPVGAVLAIYARESGQGMALPPEAEEGEDAAAADTASATPALSAVADVGAVDDAVDGNGESDDGNGDAPPPPPRPAGGRGHLRVIK